MTSTSSSCVCTGIRTCGICRPDLYQQIPERHDGNNTVKIIQCLWCPECKNIFQESFAKSVLTCCEEHQQGNDDESKIMTSQHFFSLGLKPFCGFAVVPNFVTFFDEHDDESNSNDGNDQEKLIINYLDHGRAINANQNEKEEEHRQKDSSEQIDKKCSSPIWQPSQSGRRKVDFGPRANFKQRKAQPRSTFLGFPIELKRIVERVSQQVTKLSSPSSATFSTVSHCECSFGYRFTCNKGMEIPDEIRQEEGDCECGKGMKNFQDEKEEVKCDDDDDEEHGEDKNEKNEKTSEGVQDNAALFQIVEIAALEYQPSVSSNLDPHMDDAWIWGARVVGVSLLSASVMTFVQCSSTPSAVCVHLRVPLPRGALFVLSDSSRYHWLHGIQASDIKNRRVSLTIRELSREFSAAEPELATECLAMAKNFV